MLSTKPMVSTVYWLNASLLPAGALPAASRTLYRFRVSRLLVVRASLAVGVKVAVQTLPSVPTGVRSPSVPLAWDRSMAFFAKPVTRSLKVKVMVALSPAVRRASLIVTLTVGRTGSMLKLPLVPGPTPAVSCAARTALGFTRVAVLVEVEGDGVVGALGAGLGGVCGGPDLAVGADRRQGARRAFAGVVLDVLGTKAGYLLAEGQGDGHRLAGPQDGGCRRDGDRGRQTVVDVVAGREAHP